MKRKSFREDQRGGVAVLIGLCGFVLVVMGGAATDVARGVAAKDRFQQVLDSAVLAAGAVALTEPAGSTPDVTRMTDAAETAFTANLPPEPGLTHVTFRKVTYDAASDSVTGRLDVQMRTSFLGMLGIDEFSIALRSTAVRPRPSPLEVVVALDATSSMNGAFGNTTKIAALRASAKDLVTTLMKSEYAKMGLVPFAGTIRLPNNEGYANNTAGGSNMPWLSLSAPPVVYDCYAPTNCTYINYTCYADGVPYSCSLRSCSCSDWRRRVNNWAGCVIDRPGVNGLTIANPTMPQYVGSWSEAGCTMPVVTNLMAKGESKVSGSRTYTAEAWLNARIDALVPAHPSYSTHIPTGLIWSWNMLTAETVSSGARDPNFPLQEGFTQGEVDSLGVRRALVLISDGANSAFVDTSGTQRPISALPAVQQASTLAQVNSNTLTICNRMKASGIAIYVVALQIGNDLAFKSLLESCSSNYDATTGQVVSGDYFFNTQSPTQLTQAFEKIGKSFNRLTLTN